MPIQFLDVGHVHHCMTTVVRKALSTLCPDKSGGYFCVLDVATGLPRMTTLIGSVDSLDRGLLCQHLAQEKALRLWEHLPEGHTSSWQSRNPAENKFGGAILCGPFIYSFSNLPELIDEAAMLAYAARYTQHGEKVCDPIAEISQNPYYRQLLDPNSAVRMQTQESAA